VSDDARMAGPPAGVPENALGCNPKQDIADRMSSKAPFSDGFVRSRILSQCRLLRQPGGQVCIDEMRQRQLRIENVDCAHSLWDVDELY